MSARVAQNMSSTLTSGETDVVDIVKPDFHQVRFKIEDYIQSELKIKLDKYEQICQANLSATGCPLGAQCPLRHTTPNELNFQPNTSQSATMTNRDRLITVCKHWLRGLCKKGDACEFLHEYNLRRMPECWWYARYGYCTSGDECLYAHPKERKKECPDYMRGFCKLGPECPRKHVRRVACKLYMSGFCPMGSDCTHGHPKPGIPTEKDYRPPSPPSPRELGPPPPGFGRFIDGEGNPQQMAGGFVGGGMGPHNTFPGQGRGRGDAGPGGEPFTRRNLDEVTCFKCGQRGHYANFCKNPNVPGDRGGLQRQTRKEPQF